MKIELDGLEAFVHIAEGGSFHKAAQALHISQPALSRRMKRLEEITGVRLLDRTTQKVQLTAVGRAFLPQAQRLVLELRAAADSLGKMSTRRGGMVSVACIPTAAAHFLPSAIGRYAREHPDVRVRVMDFSSAEVVQAVLQGAAEFGVSFVERLHQDLEFEPLFEDPFVVVCHRSHPLAQKSKVAWSELAEHRVARVGPRSGSSILLDLALSRLGVRLNWFHEVEYHFSSALGLTEAGLVVTVMPRLAVPERGSAQLVARPLGDPPLRRQLGIVRRRGSTPSPAAEGLIEVLRSIGAGLSADDQEEKPARLPARNRKSKSRRES
jgi:DNA-binding transcriptional LysR family regulator